MKIVHIAHYFLEEYGYQDTLLPVTHAQLGHEVTVISTQQGAGAYYFKVNPELLAQKKPYYYKGCNIIRLPLKQKVNYRFARYKGLYECLTEESPDLIFFHEIPYLNYIDIIKYVKRFHCKLFVDFHCDYINSGKSVFSHFFLHKIFYRFILSMVNKYVDLYYGITPGTITFIKKMYKIPVNKIKLLPLGGVVDDDIFVTKDFVRAKMRQELGILDSDKLIVTAGKIDRKKNTHNLIAAVDSLKNPFVHLAIIGTFEENYYKEFESIITYNQTIHVLGWKSPEEINQYFLASDIACFPGEQSALWQQAICCGLPLLCRYWAGEGTEYLDRGGNVQFLYDGSIIEIRKNIEKLLIHNTEKLQSMREVASTNGTYYFSYANIAQSIVDDFEKHKEDIC